MTADVRIDACAIGALAWLAPGRALALEEIAGERQRLLAIDLVKRRVVARHALGGSVQRIVRTAQDLVLLLAPAQTIGAARIAVADRRGAVRFVRLGRMLVGSKLLGTGSDHRVDIQLPGLAIDPKGRRAFVVDRSVAAAIDLRSLAVSYHSLKRPRPFLRRTSNRLEPAAAAKQVSGYVREASWLGSGLLALSGADTVGGQTQAAGLMVVDTRGWSARLVDRDATGFEVAGDVLLATGGSWDAAAGRTAWIGLVAYDFDGDKRFQLFDGQQAWLNQVYGGHAYVGISGQEAVQVVDLAAGSVVATRQLPLPGLLLGSGGGWW